MIIIIIHRFEFAFEAVDCNVSRQMNPHIDANGLCATSLGGWGARYKDGVGF